MSCESSHPTNDAIMAQGDVGRDRVDLDPPPVMREHPLITHFCDICDEMKAVHRRKSHDYGYKNSPYANFDQSESFGVAPFTGLMLRLNDKVVRIQNFIKKGRLLNESVEDALLDIAIYAIIGLVKIRFNRREAAFDGPRQD